jgi:alkanesulfonate monooxygenase SsuD/methylene tetrahydromethanopterin reductase-like flavin-dependent oxidoreductase (luciferase family)
MLGEGEMRAEPGRLTFGFKTSPQHVSYSVLDSIWKAAAELPIFAAAWMNDHLGDPAAESGGSSFESMTVMASLAHNLPGVWLGHSVLANTFRHPALLAKAATTMDHVTGGRFVVGLGAGWHAWEHEAFGIPLPPPPERFERLAATVRVLRALGSSAAAAAPGVTLDDPRAPLRGATNEPPPLAPGGPPIFLGGQGPRGLRLAAEAADGWFVPSTPIVSPGLFAARRAAILAAMEEVGRDPTGFQFVAQVAAGGAPATRSAARALTVEYARVGATHICIAIPARLGPPALVAAALEVAEPAAAEIG